MANTTYNSTQVMINKSQSLKGKTNSKFYKKMSNYHDDMNNRRQSGAFQFEEDPFSKNVQGIGKYYHEVFLLIKVLQTKPSFKNMNINYYDLYYTVNKNRDDKDIMNDKKEYKEN